MPKKEKEAPKEMGIPGLPKNWSVAVQLVGTFGLAVFLVLYYVLVMQPRDAERYDRLRESIASLQDIVEKQQSLLTREQASRLEDLFVSATSHEIADLIVHEVKNGTPADALGKQIEDKLIFQTRMLEGLRRKDGGTVSEMLTHKIRNSEISREIAARAVGEWRDADYDTLARNCQDGLYFAIKRAAMAK